MINSAFFPTPKAVIEKMIAPLLKEAYAHHRYLPYSQILEPSAGKGDIADYITKYCERHTAQVFCIEIEPELQMILSGKGYKVIDSDFLCYADHYLFDLIVMNPPFDQGVDHLLKAWEVLHAGDVVCVLNAETILNPYTEKRKLLKRIIDQHGRYENIGAAFRYAERPTDVECVIVWLHKEGKDSNISFDDILVEHDVGVRAEPEFSANPLANANIIASLVDQYTQAAKLLVDMHRLRSQYRFYTQTVIDSKGDSERAPATLNDEINDLKKAFWRYVFDKTKLGRATTSSFQKKFGEFSNQTQAMAFSVANIMHVLEIFFLNHEQIIQECIVDVFDKATKYHEKNVVHTEGWKTNKSWKIAPKIIMPNGITYEPKWNSWNVNYYERPFYDDLDKALCFLSGRSLESVHTIYQQMDTRLTELSRGMNPKGYADEFDSTFFKIRIFKKGTVHLTFRDKDLLAQFNRAAAEGKNWVGAGY